MPLSFDDLLSGFRALGVQPGLALEVHSSLSSFGQVQGGAATVIRALIAAVGVNGSILMPAFPLTKPLPLSADDRARGMVAKVRFLDPDSDEPTGMGAIADAFRRWPGVLTGPGFHRVCAWGRDADLHSQGFQHLLDTRGHALLLGVDIHRLSSMHYMETPASPPPQVRAIFAPPPDVLDIYPADGWYVECGVPPEDAWGKIQTQAEGMGLIHRGCIGQAQCMLFVAADVVELYRAALQTDPLGLYGLKKTE